MTSKIVLENDISLNDAVAGALAHAGGNFYASPSGAWGIVPDIQLVILNADTAGLNATGVQNMFSQNVVLDSDTTYYYELSAYLEKTAGTTSHNFRYGIGGTAVITNILRTTNNGFATTIRNGSLDEGAASPLQQGFADSTGTVPLVGLAGVINTASVSMGIFEKGTIVVGDGGTLVPYYQLSAAPGGAYTLMEGACLKIYPIGNTTEVNVGNWV